MLWSATLLSGETISESGVCLVATGISSPKPVQEVCFQSSEASVVRATGSKGFEMLKSVAAGYIGGSVSFPGVVLNTSLAPSCLRIRGSIQRASQQYIGVSTLEPLILIPAPLGCLIQRCPALRCSCRRFLGCTLGPIGARGPTGETRKAASPLAPELCASGQRTFECAIPGRRISCSAGVNAWVRMSNVLTSEVKPEATKIIARTTN